MAKRKARKPAPSRPDFVVNQQAVCVSVTVDDPGYQRQHDGAKGNTRKINATINMRESPIVYYATRGYLDEAQARTGTWVRRLHEMAGGAGVQAMDYTREPVDGGRVSDGLTDLKATSAKRLNEAREELAKNDADWRLIEQVCAWGYFVSQFTETKHQNAIQMQRLRDSLDILATFWGYKSRSAQGKAKTG